MTCIIGMVCDDEIYMGADSAGVTGINVSIRKDPKIFLNNKFLIGYTTSFRMGQILRYSFCPPKQRQGVDIYEYMCTEFIDAIISIFKKKEFARIKNNEVIGGTFLVGYCGSLFEIDSDFQVGEILKNYTSIGCGYQYALGSLYASENSIHTPETRILTALNAAQEFSGGVRAPFLIKKI